MNASRFSGTGALQTDDPALEQARSLLSNAGSDVFKLQRSACLHSVKLVIDSGFSMISVSIALVIAASSCIGHAIPAAFQGALILESKRFSPFALAALGRAALTMTLILSIYAPIILIAPLIAIAAFWTPAHSNWIPSGLTPAARQAYRRTTRQSDRHRKASESRTKGSLVNDGEE